MQSMGGVSHVARKWRVCDSREKLLDKLCLGRGQVIVHPPSSRDHTPSQPPSRLGSSK